MVASEDELMAVAQPMTRLNRRRRARWAVALVGVGVIVIASAVAILGRGWAPRASPAGSPASPTQLPSMAAEAGRLTWAPPALDHPVDIRVTERNHVLRLDPKTDYRVYLPTAAPLKADGGLIIMGGHNIVMIGGEIQVPTSAEVPDPAGRRALYLKDQTGTVHIEGVKLSGDLAEGIDLDERLGATVQLENIAVGTIRGSLETNHADLIQTWAGPSVLRVDGFSGTTDYQGFFLLPDQHFPMTPAAFDLRRVVITAITGSGYLLWTRPDATWLTISDIYLVDPNRDNLAKMLWPVGPWEGVRLLATNAGARLPAGNPGLGYQTPGYQSDPIVPGSGGGTG